MVRQKIVHCGKGTKTYYREVDIIMGKKTSGHRGAKGRGASPSRSG